ncbi:TOMM precursor leader peptide-binding protein [Hyalangium gracile]|uniref:TOMM precursor leader peptide-binding protein n=1 Tax=Hyalangium gracile TaxID=394092 RepID=UPI001CCE2560|nr:TOMM precursor leader peptide-binding protein [Hyalangium gracile]
MSDPFNRVMQFKAHLRLEALDAERAFLLGEREQFMLTGRSQVLVASKLDGRRSVQQVITDLEGQVSAPEVLYALANLEKRGHIIEASSALPSEIATFWQALGVNPAQAAARLEASPVAVRTQGGLDPAPLVEALRGAGLTVKDNASLQVVLVDDYLAPELEELNRRALERREPWFLVKPSGAMPWMGPVFRPGEGPCWACLSQRLRANRPVETFLRENKSLVTPLTLPRAELPASRQTGLHLAALALARWVAADQQGSLGHTLLALELPRFQLTEHAVVRRPQCPACGDPDLLKKRADKPVVLEARPRGFTEDNGFRTVTPEQTFARLQPQISPITGVLATLAPLESRSHALRPVFGTTFFCPVSSKTPYFSEFHSISLGKGRTPAQSRASALGEGIERWSSLYQGDEPRIRARLSELGADAYHPRDLLLFSDAQYRDREANNAKNLRERMTVPVPFDERLEVEWTPVWSLTHERRRYMPTSYCYNRYPAAPSENFSPADSNGAAAGNCLEEAILQGFLELAERDAAGIWWYNRLRRPGVDIHSFNDPYFQALQEHYRAHHWRIWALDLTNDVEIPAFVALGMSSRTGQYCIGFGAHLDAHIALQRAITEFNQIFDPSENHKSPWQDFKLEDASFLHPDETLPPRTAADYPKPPMVDIRDDVRGCVARVERLGMETLVLDMTRPDVGLHVVKVSVPGLRHFWPRFAPGRLYDVPVKLGWRSSPLTEAQLNPVPFLL